MDKVSISFKMDIEVNDPEAFAAAAVARAISDGVDPDDAAARYSADDLSACAVMLFDPGESPAGCEIQGSEAESHEWLNEMTDDEVELVAPGP